MPEPLKLFHPLKSTSYPITQKFGENPQWYPLTQGHNGIDFGIPLRTDIYATLPGKVVRVAGDNSGYGNHIRISHDDNLLSLYGHLDERNYHTVNEGDNVVAGQHIGFSGNTGRSTGPHLHFEVRRNNVAFDILPLLTTEILGIPTPPPPATKFKIRVLDTTQPFLNVRSGPDILYPIIDHINPGEEVEVLDIASNTLWLQTARGFIAFRYDGNGLAEIVVED